MTTVRSVSNPSPHQYGQNLASADLRQDGPPSGQVGQYLQKPIVLG
mgnify:CR=1 FL=1